MWWGQRCTPPRPERVSNPPQDAWMERHQRLRDPSQLAQRRHDVRHTRHEVQQQTLQLHLSPHFMFNALSSVQWLWSEHKRDRAARLFSNFVTLWRHHWRSHEASTHTLQEELESLQAYLTLEVQRLGRAVAMEVRIDPSVSRQPPPCPASSTGPGECPVAWPRRFCDPPPIGTCHLTAGRAPILGEHGPSGQRSRSFPFFFHHLNRRAVRPRFHGD